MDKKYIECETILKQIEEIKNDFSPTVRPMFDVFKHMLTEAPAADVKPVVHGEWIKTGNETLFSNEVRCSNCGKIQLGETSYCPNCGTCMYRDTRREVGFNRDPKNYNISERFADGGNK